MNKYESPICYKGKIENLLSGLDKFRQKTLQHFSGIFYFILDSNCIENCNCIQQALIPGSKASGPSREISGI